MDLCVLELVSPTKDGHFMYAGLGVRYRNLIKMFIIGKTPGIKCKSVYNKILRLFLHTHLFKFIEKKVLGLLLII